MSVSASPWTRRPQTSGSCPRTVRRARATSPNTSSLSIARHSFLSTQTRRPSKFTTRTEQVRRIPHIMMSHVYFPSFPALRPLASPPHCNLRALPPTTPSPLFSQVRKGLSRESRYPLVISPCPIKPLVSVESVIVRRVVCGALRPCVRRADSCAADEFS